MNVWVDIDNEPQARYLVPLARAFEQNGHQVVLTARDHGDTLQILQEEGVPFRAVGSTFGRGVPRKLRGLASRARELDDFVSSGQRNIDFVITGSRSATLAARRRRIPSFVIIDYEFVHLRLYRLTGSYILYPDVIPTAAFIGQGIRAERLLPFQGLKEDLSFHGLDLAEIEPFDLGSTNGSPKILFRPPAEESHYYQPESRDLALALLRHFGARDVQVVLSPRSESQLAYLDEVEAWQHEPIVLERAVPFVSLLKSVDAVVSAGGTMLREAAYLGIPAYSIFRSRIGAVDRHLVSIGRLAILSSPADFSRIELQPTGVIEPLAREFDTVEAIVQKIEAGLVGETG